ARPDRPSTLARIRAAAGRIAGRVREAVRPVAVVFDVLRMSGTVRRTVMIAAGVGVTVGAITLAAPDWLAAAISGTVSASAAVAVRAGSALRSLLARVRPA
ncbi:MAG: hypothetical protein JWO38_4646, partial [Gemmataceae bacterium]|nr:hypothetical protein [Gemmataceae bacterium]